MRFPAPGMLLLAVSLTGCSTIAGWFQSSDTGPKPTPLTEFSPTATLQVAWQESVGASKHSVLTPAYHAGVVYAGAEDGTVNAFDSATGRRLWSVSAGGRLTGGVGAGPERIVVGTEKAEVIALDASGKAAWKVAVTSEVLGVPTVHDGLVVVRCADGRIFGLDAGTGNRRWTYQRSLPSLTVRSHAGFSASRGALFAGLPGGKVVAMELSSGAVGWEGTVAQPRGATELERIADVTSSPLIDGDLVCAVAFQGRVACFDAASGTPRWNREVSSYAGLDMDRRAVYIADEQGAVVALDRNQGASLWRQDKLKGRQLTAPLAIGRWVAVGDLEGYVHLLSIEDGALAARVSTGGSRIVAPLIPLGEGFAAQTAGGAVVALKAR